MPYGTCKQCGCTDNNPCSNISIDPMYCWWMTKKHTLCSHCGIDQIRVHPKTVHASTKRDATMMYDILHLMKMKLEELKTVAEGLQISMISDKKQDLIYQILDKQALCQQ